MRTRTFDLDTDVRPDFSDLKPFFERPKAIRIEASDDLTVFRLHCAYRFDPSETGVSLGLQTCEFMRLVDGRFSRLTFREERPRTRHAFDEALDALLTLRLYAANLPPARAGRLNGRLFHWRRSRRPSYARLSLRSGACALA
jgi:hypothetical protein